MRLDRNRSTQRRQGRLKMEEICRVWDGYLLLSVFFILLPIRFLAKGTSCHLAFVLVLILFAYSKRPSPRRISSSAQVRIIGHRKTCSSYTPPLVAQHASISCCRKWRLRTIFVDEPTKSEYSPQYVQLTSIVKLQLILTSSSKPSLLLISTVLQHPPLARGTLLTSLRLPLHL
jgi:hypothetical protein